MPVPPPEAKRDCPSPGRMRHFPRSRTLLEFELPKQLAQSPIAIRNDSPWGAFDPILGLPDNGPTIGRRKHPPFDIVELKTFPRQISGPVAFSFIQLQAPAFVRALDVMKDSQCLYVILERPWISLSQALRCARPGSAVVSYLLRQIIGSVVRIEALGLEHHALGCESVFLTEDGMVKIGKQEACRPRTMSAWSHDKSALAGIAMEVMEEERKDGGKIGLNDPARWSPVPFALDFLSDLSSPAHLKELLQHPFLKCETRQQQVRDYIGAIKSSLRRDIMLQGSW